MRQNQRLKGEKVNHMPDIRGKNSAGLHARYSLPTTRYFSSMCFRGPLCLNPGPDLSVLPGT